MARVDRLGEGHRMVLQVASAIGRRFPLELVQAAADINGNLPRYLGDLESQELIFRQEGGGGGEYAFKHALTQEAIYDSLLGTRRADLHQRVAEAIEQSYGDRLVEWAEVLAHHWSRTPRADKAVRYLALAGEKSLRLYSVEEAHERFSRVADLLENQPDCADDRFLAHVLRAWARVHYYRKDYAGLIGLRRYLPRVEALGETRHLSLFLFWLGFAHLFPADADTARPLLERALAVGERLGDDECIGYACMGLTFLYELKPFGTSRNVVEEFASRGLTLGERLGDVYLTSKCLLGFFIHDLFDAKYDAAGEIARRTIAVGKDSGDPRATAMGLSELATVNIYDERFTEAVENADEALRLSPDPLDRVCARANKGLALAFSGKTLDGVALAREAIDDLRTSGARAVGTWFDVPFGVALVISGQLTAGVGWIEAAIGRAIEDGNQGLPASGHMVLGEIYLAMVRGEKKTPLPVILKNAGFIVRTLPFARRLARRHLQEAVRRAREADLPGVLARSLFDLGLLSTAGRRSAEARRHFEEALPLAEAHSMTLAAKIRAELTARR
jgi:tetratricopeptide (TPR) repeat protein